MVRAVQQATRFCVPLAAAAWLAACAMPYHSDASAPAPDPFNPAATQLLDDTQWQLVSWQHADGSVINVPSGDASSVAHAAITLDLSTANGQRRASGAAGCNHYTGRYVLKNGLLSFNQIASTKMACMAADGQIESAYLGALAHIVRSGVQRPVPDEVAGPCACASHPKKTPADNRAHESVAPQAQRLLLQLDNGDQLTFVQRLPSGHAGN
jgi:heat shock protein HslJ